MFFFKTNPNPVPEEDTQVEISLDSLGQIYDIIVTDRKKLQSVVSVPRTKRRRTVGDLFLKHRTTTIYNNNKATSTETAGGGSGVEGKGRLADCLRPASPLRPNHRSHSCPPPLARGRSGCVRTTTSAPTRHREYSLPPTAPHRQRQNRDHQPRASPGAADEIRDVARGMMVWDTSKESMVRTSQKSISKSGKPNLVTSRRYRNDPNNSKTTTGGRRKNNHHQQ
jgi:hypothetical protein